MITIVDYGMGNLGSMVNMFKYLGTDVCVESEPSKIESAKKLVLPGVGKFDAAMKCIKKNYNLLDLLSYKVCEEKIPILGICLGMQLFTNSSEEGSEKGLGWIPGVVKKFPYNSDHRIPHMGWNDAVVLKKNSLVLKRAISLKTFQSELTSANEKLKDLHNMSAEALHKLNANMQ